MSRVLTLHPRRHARRPSRRAFTLVEMIVALALVGLLMAAVTRQMVESASLSMKVASTLEYSRNGRALIGQLQQDVASAQVVRCYSEFSDRSSPVGTGAYANYVVLHQVNADGTVARTVGYYLASNGDDTYALYRHDSADGVIPPGTLPDVGTAKTHRRLVRTVQIPDGVKLFRKWRNRGLTLRGQFGTADGHAYRKLEYLQCTFTTRS